MEIPDLVADHLGSEELRRGVMLGDDDVVCITATRTLLYRSDGLLSDESVTEYPHNVERLQINEGRRKSKFVLDYVEGSESIGVPNDVARDVLGLLMEGILLEENLIDDDESVTGAFRFSELTLVVCDSRVIKHVGNAVWEEDFEMFAFQDLTGLEFEKASVATELVLRIDGRPERIKTPNDKARLVEQTVKKAVFEYFDVTSVEELNDHFRATADTEESTEDEESGDIGLGNEGIDPLVDDSTDDGPFADSFSGGSETDAGGPTAESQAAESDPEGRPSSVRSTAREDESVSGRQDQGARSATDRTSGRDQQAPTAAAPEADPLTREDLDEVTTQLSELTEAVNRQNDLLRDQQQAIKQLIEELRQGR